MLFMIDCNLKYQKYTISLILSDSNTTSFYKMISTQRRWSRGALGFDASS